MIYASKAEFVFDDICNTLSNPPKECSKYVESSTIFQTEVSTEWPTLVLVISLGILIFSLIVLITLLSFVSTVAT